jgi:hypothetical protein
MTPCSCAANKEGNRRREPIKKSGRGMANLLTWSGNLQPTVNGCGQRT